MAQVIDFTWFGMEEYPRRDMLLYSYGLLN